MVGQKWRLKMCTFKDQGLLVELDMCLCFLGGERMGGWRSNWENLRDDGVVEMAFDEHEAWKNGLIVEGIELRPK